MGIDVDDAASDRIEFHGQRSYQARHAAPGWTERVIVAGGRCRSQNAS